MSGGRVAPGDWTGGRRELPLLSSWCKVVVLSTVTGVEGEIGGNAHGTKYAVGWNGSGCVDYALKSIEGRRGVV